MIVVNLEEIIPRWKIFSLAGGGRGEKFLEWEDCRNRDMEEGSLRGGGPW